MASARNARWRAGPGASSVRGMTLWVRRLLVANIAVFVLTSMQPGLETALAFSPVTALARPWTILTYMFVHHGFEHILWNMVGLFFFGPRVETRLGSRRFLGLYFTGGIAGAILTWLAPVAGFGTLLVQIVGASGAIFGVFLAYARYWPHDRVLLWFVIPVPAYALIIGLTLISVLGGVGSLGGFEADVAHWGHLGGFIGGYLYLKVIETRTGSARFRAIATATAPVPRGDTMPERWMRIDRASLHPVNRDELERVLAKLATGGPTGLTTDERAFLDRLAGA